jgi:hypothetical protein
LERHGQSAPQVFPSAQDLFEPPDDTGEKTIRAESVVREWRAVWIVHGMGRHSPSLLRALGKG